MFFICFRTDGKAELLVLAVMVTSSSFFYSFYNSSTKLFILIILTGDVFLSFNDSADLVLLSISYIWLPFTNLKF